MTYADPPPDPWPWLAAMVLVAVLVAAFIWYAWGGY